MISNPKGSILSLLWVLLLLHAVFLLYINLRKKIVPNPPKTKPFIITRCMYVLMDFLRIPRTEIGYFQWFNIVAVAGLIVYLLAINSIPVSWQLGPFPFVLLAFAVLLGFGNILTALSVKTNINLHFIIFIIAFLLGSKETHYVRTKQFDTPPNMASITNARIYKPIPGIGLQTAVQRSTVPKAAILYIMYWPMVALPALVIGPLPYSANWKTLQPIPPTLFPATYFAFPEPLEEE